MDIDPTIQQLIQSEPDETVNVIIGIRPGAGSVKAALDGAGFETTGSTEIGSEVLLYGRIRAKNIEKLRENKEIEFIAPDSEQNIF